MKKILKIKQGFSYIDVVVTILCSMFVIVLSLNTFTFLSQRQALDYFAREMIQVAVINGTINDTVIDERISVLKNETGLDPMVEYSSSSDKNGKVQFGEIIKVKLTYNTTFQGFGVFDIPLTLTVQKSGVSQKYWK